MRFATLSPVVLLLVCAIAEAQEPLARIVRKIPPAGIEIPAAMKQKWLDRVEQLTSQLSKVESKHQRADVECLVKAVRLALLHGEFYNRKELPRAESVLSLAEKRLAAPSSDQKEKGLLVRGYYSSIDGSAQPYGLVVPDLKPNKKVPLYVWLHGRGDKITDLHFIHRRLSSAGQIKPEGAIILHPFGRHCVGYKWAGEIDVLEAIEDVKARYPIDEGRIVLMGFSMGGAGCWHVGAHYADQFVAMSPGAGFAETAEYNRLKPASFPPQIEQTMWRVYDVPNYVRNLFNIPVVAYSGENDKQIQAAQVMERAFESEKRKLPHIIGPKMGHRYHPDSLKEIVKRMTKAVADGTQIPKQRVFLQTRTLRYSKMYWVQATGLQTHWEDSRVDARISGDRELTVTTKNVRGLRLSPWPDMSNVRLNIDGQTVKIPSGERVASLARQKGQWKAIHPPADRHEKRPGLQGPIDDVFLSAFLVVRPTGKSRSQRLNRWVEFEIKHFADRWRALYRGDLPIKDDTEITENDIKSKNLIIWGDRDSNLIFRRILNTKGKITLPLVWSEGKVKIGAKSFSGKHQVPAMIYPNPLNQHKYVVINSGLTFREGHDRTNSLQNAKVGDWAVFDITTKPNEFYPGKLIDSGVFDEFWK